MLGDAQKHVPAQSAYKDSISNNASNFPSKRENTMIDSKKTNINIGKGGAVNYTSEAKDKFVSNLHGQHGATTNTNHNLAYLKQNHFAFGDGAKNDYSTVNRADFGTKLNPGYKKTDGNMQTTSFKMGYQGTPFNSNTPSANQQAHTDRGKTVPYKREVGGAPPKSTTAKGATSMHKENFSLGKSGGEFRTMNQAYYRWIQPKADFN